MPMPDGLARFNRSATNRLTKPFAARMPGFAVVHHKGRQILGLIAVTDFLHLRGTVSQ